MARPPRRGAALPPAKEQRSPADVRKAVYQMGFVEQRNINLPRPPNWDAPAPYDKHDLAAFKAFREGRAEPYQQELVLNWLIMAARTYEETFAADPQESAYLQGMRRVGRELVKMINMPVTNSEGEQG